MAYLARLDQARERLNAGEFLAAEQFYLEACAEFESSRVTAPLLEKGIDPLLRQIGRVFGRNPENSILPRFGERADRVRADLEEVARLLAVEAEDAAERLPAERDREHHRRLGRALRLLRESEIFKLDQRLHWPVLRGYLEGAQQPGLLPDPSLLPHGILPPEDETPWLVDYAEDALRRGGSELLPLARWLGPQLQAAPAQGAVRGHALTVACRLALVEPSGAPAALALGRAALREDLGHREAAALLRVVAGLLCNEERLASPGASLLEIQALDAHAADIAMAWPPADLVELLGRRHPADRPGLALLAVEGTGPSPRVLLLRLVGGQPTDAFTFRLDEGGAGEDPFCLAPTAARAALEYWLAADGAILCATEPPPSVAALLSPRPLLALDQLEQALPVVARPAPIGMAAAPHPLFENPLDPVAETWESLLREGLTLLPRILARVDTPAFRARWGQSNLRALERAGLPLAGALQRVLETLPPIEAEAIPSLQALGLSVELWAPRLSERDWPREGEAAEAPPWMAEGDQLLPHAPDAEELAGWALALEKSEILAGSQARALELGRRIAATIGGRSLTVAPSRLQCPEAALAGLDRWLQEAASSRPGRAADALWLYAALVRSPEGDLARWLGEGGSSEGRLEIEAWLAGQPDACGPQCRLSASGECWHRQLAERRSNGRCWLEWSSIAVVREGEAPFLLVDDLAAALAGQPDALALDQLERIATRISRSQRAILWASIGPFAPALREALGRRLPGDRVPQLPLREESDGPILRVVPTGYEPGSRMMGMEALRLIHARWRALLADEPSALSWMPGALEEELRLAPPPGGGGKVSGVVHGQKSDKVVLPLLAAAGPVDAALGLLRLGAAASHAERELHCLDPRVHGLATGLPLGGTAGASGAEVLSSLPKGEAGAWAHPIDAARLRDLAGGNLNRSETLAQALSPLRQSVALALGGARDDERELVLQLVEQLSRESGDGGPLALRSIVEVDLLPPPGRIRSRPLEEELLALDRGEEFRLCIGPEELAQDALQRWARRNPSVLWVIRRAEFGLTEHPAFRPTAPAQIALLLELRAEARSAAILFVDDASTAEFSPLARMENAHALRLATMGERAGEGWTVERLAVADPIVTCPSCRRTAACAHRWSACPDCGKALLEDDSPRHEVQQSLENWLEGWLQDQGPHAPWLVLCRDDAESQRLARRLGLSGAMLPLVDAAQGSEAWTLQTRSLSGLWSPDPLEPRELLLSSLPPDGAWLRALFLRLHAAGWEPGRLRIADHPLEAAPGPDEAQARCRWQCNRLEFEARLQAALSQADQMAGDHGADGAHEAGLGPEGDPARPGRLGILMRAASQHPEGRLPSHALSPVAEAWLARPELEEAPGFDGGAAPLRTADPALAAIFQWAKSVGLLREIESSLPSPRLQADFRRRLRSEAPGRQFPLPLPELPTASIPALSHAPAAAATPWPKGEWRLGIPGSGKTRDLLAVALAPRAGGDRSLVLVPGETGLRAVERELPSMAANLEVATVDELCLAFLHRHRERAGFSRRPRRVPPAGTPEGMRLREELMREASRRYALEAGGVPPIESTRLARLLEGDEASARLVAAGEEEVVDLDLLRRVAREAAGAGGWVHDEELAPLARRVLESDPTLATGWRTRYPAVFVDDAHALGADALAFLDQLFPAEDRWTTADPLRLERQRLTGAKLLQLSSRRWTKNFARDVERLWRSRPDLPGRLRGEARGGGRIRSEHVFSLEACIQRIDALMQPGRGKKRQAVLVAHADDRHRMAARLREEGWSVWSSERVGRLAAPALRPFLALLWLLDPPAHTRSEDLEALAGVAMAAGGVRASTPPSGRILEGLSRGEAPPPLEAAEEWLSGAAQLASRRPELGSLGRWARAVERSGLLAPLFLSDASSGRLADFMDEYGEQHWAELRDGLDPRILAAPDHPHDVLRLLSPRQVDGSEFDTLLALCTGHEGVEMYSAAAAACSGQLSFLYSERDPLEGLA